MEAFSEFIDMYQVVVNMLLYKVQFGDVFSGASHIFKVYAPEKKILKHTLRE